MNSSCSNLDRSLQQMPYAFATPENAFCKEADKLIRRDLSGMKAPMPKASVKEASQSGRSQLQFDPSQRAIHSMSWAELKERSKMIVEHGWGFDPKRLSFANPNQRSYPAIEFNKSEFEWLSALQLMQVIEENRARQTALDQGKRSLTWETNDVNPADCELLSDESLDQELNAFYGPTEKSGRKTDNVPIHCESNVDDNEIMSTTCVSVRAEYSGPLGSSSNFRTNPIMSFNDSGISVGDHFPADNTKMSTATIDNGDCFPRDGGHVSPEGFNMDDYIVSEPSTEPSTVPSPMPTFAVQEASKADRDFLRNLYCNDIGVGDQFLDAPYDLEDWANENVNLCDDDNMQIECAANPDDLETSSTQHVNLFDSENTQLIPHESVDYISPAHNAVDELETANNISTGTITVHASVQFNATDNYNLSADVPSQESTYSPDGSAAAGNQLLTDVHTYNPDTSAVVGNQLLTDVHTYNPDTSAAAGNQLRLTDVQGIASPAVGVLALAPAPSISTESESSSDIIASSSPSRVTPYMPRGSKMLSSSRINYHSESDSSDYDREDRDHSVKALPVSTPPRMAKPGTMAADCSIHDCSAMEFDAITDVNFNLGLQNLATSPVFASTPTVPSTPTNKGRTGVRKVIEASPKNCTPIDEEVIKNMRAYHQRTTPIAAGPISPTTPLAPYFSSSDPYPGAYSFTASPTPNGPFIETVLHGQLLATPKRRTPEEEAALKVRRARAKKIMAAREAAAAAAAAASLQEAIMEQDVQTTKQKDDADDQQPPKKRTRRSKAKNNA